MQDTKTDTPTSSAVVALCARLRTVSTPADLEQDEAEELAARARGLDLEVWTTDTFEVGELNAGWVDLTATRTLVVNGEEVTTWREQGSVEEGLPSGWWQNTDEDQCPFPDPIRRALRIPDADYPDPNAAWERWVLPAVKQRLLCLPDDADLILHDGEDGRPWYRSAAFACPVLGPSYLDADECAVRVATAGDVLLQATLRPGVEVPRPAWSGALAPRRDLPTEGLPPRSLERALAGEALLDPDLLFLASEVARVPPARLRDLLAQDAALVPLPCVEGARWPEDRAVQVARRLRLVPCAAARAGAVLDHVANLLRRPPAEVRDHLRRVPDDVVMGDAFGGEWPLGPGPCPDRRGERRPGRA